MKKLKAFFLVLAVSICLVLPVNAATLYTIVMDASGSIGRNDFETENAAAAAFLNIMHQANTMEGNQGTLADFMSVAWFGGNDDYIQGPYFNVSSAIDTIAMSEFLLNVRHPSYGATAIYSAILKSTLTTVNAEEMLGGVYNHVILVTTDGSDTQSPLEAKRLVRQLYPNRKIFLGIIGVGPAAKLDEFRGIADDLRHVDDFGELAAVFTLYRNIFK